eukprot:TRINITY_DN944_c0_g1_i4.p2 TRINITY_DN944_c0_g1~~TRINITY_DN944_c0_g1_i4.p2  ORF type:complete len:145 (-),score=40.67 TRINITY_DN944_c0_g1_i4:589-1023(-)
MQDNSNNDNRLLNKEFVIDILPKVTFIVTFIPTIVQLIKYKRNIINVTNKHFPHTLTVGMKVFCSSALLRLFFENFANEIGIFKPPKTNTIFYNSTLSIWSAVNLISYALHPNLGFCAVFSTSGCEVSRLFMYAVRNNYISKEQ